MRKNSIMLVAASNPSPGKEAEYNKWYNNHITMLFDFKELKRASRYRRYNLHTGDNKEKCTKYLTIYEFETKKALETLPDSPAFAAASKDAEENWASLGDMIWSGGYEPLKSLEREKGNDSILFIVATECDPKKEKEYNNWYNEIHLPMLFEFKDTKRASRYHCYHQIEADKTECIKYLAIYEFGSKEAKAAFHQSPVIEAAGKDWEEKLSSRSFGLKLKWAAAYEPIKSLERD